MIENNKRQSCTVSCYGPPSRFLFFALSRSATTLEMGLVEPDGGGGHLHLVGSC